MPRRPLREQTLQQVWETAFRKALKQYGHKAQAERIAWAAIDAIPRRREKLKALKRRVA